MAGTGACSLALGAHVCDEPPAGPDPIVQLQKQIAELEAQLAEARAELARVQALESTSAAEPAGGEPVQAPAEPAPALQADEPAEAQETAPHLPEQAGSDPASIPVQRSAIAQWLASWKSRIEIGLNGTEGNRTRQSLRIALSSNRKTSSTDTKLSTDFRLTSQEGRRSENRLEISGRNDWLQGDSRLRYFIQGKIEFDEFKAWDVLASSFGGLGYDIIKSDKTTLIGRGGLGGSKRFGDVDDDVRVEAFLSGDLTYKISDQQKLKAEIEYLPDTEGWRAYRLNSNASWEIKIDPESDLFMRVGIASRFDSDPGRAKSTDVDYFVNLGWTF
ncbi:MAG: hypothetical protein Kow0022_01500 [Phycisphaerales bacterium]